MKNITFKGMRTMPSEHEAKDGELSLAINLVAHDGELHPRQIIDNELEQYVDADGESFRLMHRHGTLAIYEHHDDEHTYRYFWRETATGTDDEPHLFWCDERGRAANAISEMENANPQITQLFLLAVQLFQRPLNVNTLLQYLYLPECPLDGELSHRMAKQIVREGGFSNDKI